MQNERLDILIEHEAFIRREWRGEECANVGEDREVIVSRVVPIWDDTPFGKMPRGTYVGSDRVANNGGRGRYR